MFNSMFDELKEVKYFTEITDFKSLKRKTFEESSKSIGLFHRKKLTDVIIWGEMHGFSINFPQYGKMQQNPWYGESLGNRYSSFSHSMVLFSHPMVYFSIWEMYGFPHKFPTVRENATKPMVSGRSGKSITILFP